jgi:hypothetical protein
MLPIIVILRPQIFLRSMNAWGRFWVNWPKIRPSVNNDFHSISLPFSISVLFQHFCLSLFLSRSISSLRLLTFKLFPLRPISSFFIVYLLHCIPSFIIAFFSHCFICMSFACFFLLFTAVLLYHSPIRILFLLYLFISFYYLLNCVRISRQKGQFSNSTIKHDIEVLL